MAVENEITPMMQHYLKTKEENKDCLLFYRLGDFYEMFFDDAKIVSKELELTLTGKSCGMEERAPMCGVPFHAADTYINRLVNKGYKVAICEQMEDPKLAKGIVKREVIRVVTPGTNTDMQSLDSARNNYIMCIALHAEKYGIATADVTTGDFFVTQVDTAGNFFDEINKFSPSELLCSGEFAERETGLTEYRDRRGMAISVLDAWYFGEELAESTLLSHFKVRSLEGLGLSDIKSGALASGALLRYLYDTQKNSLENIIEIHPYFIGKYMMIDSSSRRNLELVETMREKQKRGSLLGVLDKTRTAMGARLLRSYVEQPLIDKAEILKRQELVATLKDQEITREEMREYLGPIRDLERLLTRITYQTANPRDMVSFKNSIEMLPPIATLLADIPGELAGEIIADMDCLEDLHKLLDESLIEEPPVSVRDGGIIKDGYSEEVSRLRAASTDGKKWLAELEATERERTGIKNLRIKYNKVFGYYLEVTNSFLDKVPEDYMRKQTLSNAERFITPRLKELEDTILGAQDRLINLEYEIFRGIREEVAGNVARIQRTARAIAKLDVFASLAYVAEHNNYCRPDINEDGTIEIHGGRHPVVEMMMDAGTFISNDTYLDGDEHRVSIITGPNMAGKSTYMRQVALIVLMAQIGSFVPADSANIGIVDRIFTRVGASDDLASGQSTFMVEMNEVANILRSATPKSLLILDEIGRGTSTFDGLAIAWAVVEHISDINLLGAKTLFATHYHELTELEGKLSGVNNYCVAVQERGDDIIFLRKIKKGGADKSYGIQVAKIAGLPDSVVKRAKEISKKLLENDVTEAVKDISEESAENIDEKEIKMEQMSLFALSADDDIINDLKDMDIGHLTPIEAINMLFELQERAKSRS
ncbi:MAG: DNA mismatch repair protein MutS [Clostridiales bacterium]|nr:DNA mismatch repair protein MutS [Clostridiales bacterium]